MDELTPYTVSTLFLVRDPVLVSAARRLCPPSTPSCLYEYAGEDALDVVGEPFHLPTDPARATQARNLWASAKQRLLARLRSLLPSAARQEAQKPREPLRTSSLDATVAAASTTTVAENEMCAACGSSVPAGNRSLHKLRCTGPRMEQAPPRSDDPLPLQTTKAAGPPVAVPQDVTVSVRSVNRDRPLLRGLPAVVSDASRTVDTSCDERMAKALHEDAMLEQEMMDRAIAESLACDAGLDSPPQRRVAESHTRASRLTVAPDAQRDYEVAWRLHAQLREEQLRKDELVARALHNEERSRQLSGGGAGRQW